MKYLLYNVKINISPILLLNTLVADFLVIRAVASRGVCSSGFAPSLPLVREQASAEIGDIIQFSRCEYVFQFQLNNSIIHLNWNVKGKF